MASLQSSAQGTTLALPGPASWAHSLAQRAQIQAQRAAWGWHNVEADASKVQGGHSGHKSRLGGVPLSQRLGEPRMGNWGTAWMGTRLADCPPVPPLRQPEQMSPYKHRFYFHTNVCGCGKYTTGRQKYDIKAKSILQKVLPGVQGASESHVSHLSETVREPDGALWRSIKQVGDESSWKGVMQSGPGSHW